MNRTLLVICMLCIAEANTHLSEALDHSIRAVSALSEKTMDISPEDAEPSDFSLMLQLAAKGHPWLD